MALSDDYDFENLVNEAEKLVVAELEVQLALPENQDVCRTEDCVLDMAALALNQTRPMYRATLLGRLYASALDEVHSEEVRTAVSRAIERVRENPSSTY